MFKKYIRNIVKEEINDIKLENTLKQLRSEHYWRDKAESEIKHREFLVNHKNQIIIGLDEENEKLEESIKKLGGTVSLKDNLLNEKNKEIDKLKDLYEQERNKNYKTLESVELKQEIEKLNGDKEVLKDALEESKNYVSYLEKETKKLNEKLDGLKYVIKKQRLSALTYENLKKTFMLIERYIKES